MKNHYILAIVGLSGSGKTNISLGMQIGDIKALVSYTTRPMRPYETNGVEHWFVSEATADHLLAAQDPLAYTEIAGYRYFTLPSQIGTSRFVPYVIDEEGLLMLRKSVEFYNDNSRTDKFILHTAYVHRDPEQIAKSTDEQRRLRDNERTHLPSDSYDIHIWNDAPSIEVLQDWSAGFSVAINSVLSANTELRHNAELHTSKIEIHKMINILNAHFDLK